MAFKADRFRLGTGKDMKASRMRKPLRFYSDLSFQLLLFILFLTFFGIPSIKKYLEKETIVISSEEETNGIEAPAITFVATKTKPYPSGWKSIGKTMMAYHSFSIVEHCQKINFTDLGTCVSNDTYNPSDFLRGAKYDGKSTSFSSNLSSSPSWTEDISDTPNGRHFTLKPTRPITRNNSDLILFNMDTTSSFLYRVS